MDAMAKHVEAMLALQRAGSVTFDYGNNLRTQAKSAGVNDAFKIPGFVPEYIRPMFCEGRDHFAGLLCPEIRRISARPIVSSSRCSLTMTTCSDGFV